MLALVLMSYAALLVADYVIIVDVVGIVAGFVEHNLTLQDRRQNSDAMLKIVSRIAGLILYVSCAESPAYASLSLSPFSPLTVCSGVWYDAGNFDAIRCTFAPGC